MEVLLRELEVGNQLEQLVDAASLLQPPAAAAAPRRGTKRQRPDSSAAAANGAEGEGSGTMPADAADAGGEACRQPEQQPEQQAQGDGAASMQVKAGLSDKPEEQRSAAVAGPDAAAKDAEQQDEGPGSSKVAAQPPPPSAQQKRVLCKPIQGGRGHTGYLTLARRAVQL